MPKDNKNLTRTKKKRNILNVRYFIGRYIFLPLFIYLHIIDTQNLFNAEIAFVKISTQNIFVMKLNIFIYYNKYIVGETNICVKAVVRF